MAIINHNWLNSHASRNYPVDDAATGIDDNGLVLPDDIILDLHISWPLAYGQFAFIGGITITENLVSVVIMAATTADSAAEFIPLGAVSLVKPFASNTQQPLTAVADGVGGFIMFGDVEEQISLRFSTAAQSRIIARVAMPYKPLPVHHIRKAGRPDVLTGIVQILHGSGIHVELQTVLVGDTTVDAIVISLDSTVDASTIFQQYVGPCGGRPESGTCELPGIETIGGVAPDCDGNIDIIFRQLVVGDFPECTTTDAGFVIDQGIGLDDVCPIRDFTRFDGTDACAESSLSIVDSSISLSSSSAGAVPGDSSISVVCDSPPFLDCFTTPIHEDWVTRVGSSVSVTATNPYTPVDCCGESEVDCDDEALQLYDLTRRNVVIWDSCGYTVSTGQTITTDVLLTAAVLTTPANAGIALNYRSNSGTTTYWVAGVDAADNKLKLWRYNGATLIVENAAPLGVLVDYTAWYRIVVTVTDVGSGGVVAIAVSVALASAPGSPLTSFAVGTTHYGTADGKHGIATDRAVATFDHWRIV